MKVGAVLVRRTVRRRVELNTESTALLTALDWTGLVWIGSGNNRTSDERRVERVVVRLGGKEVGGGSGEGGEVGA